MTNQITEQDGVVMFKLRHTNNIFSEWRLDSKRVPNLKYVFEIVDGVIKQTYEVDEWNQQENGRYNFTSKSTNTKFSNMVGMALKTKSHSEKLYKGEFESN